MTTLLARILFAAAAWLHRAATAVYLRTAEGQREQRCRECGCTDFNCCFTESGPCHWVEPDLCSGCDPLGLLA